MKKRIIIFAIIAVICVCLFIKIYDTNNTYGIPEEKWYGVGEGFEYEGLEYKLKNVEILDENLLAEKFGLDEDFLENENAVGDIKKKYFLMTLDIRVMNENYMFDFSQIGEYSKYQSSYSGEYSIMLSVNDNKLQSNQLAVGDSVEYYMVLSFNTYYYTEEGLAALSADDVALVIYDYKNECINYMCKGDRIDKNIN